MDHRERIRQFERLQKQHSRFLRGVLWKLTGDRDRFEEALQESFIQMWRFGHKMNGTMNSSYIYRIAQSAAAKAWRNSRLRPAGLVETDCTHTNDPDQTMIAAEQLDRLRHTIAALPIRQGRALIMRYLEGYEYSELAEKMSCTESTARSHVSKALATLKQKLGSSYVGENHG